MQYIRLLLRFPKTFLKDIPMALVFAKYHMDSSILLDILLELLEYKYTRSGIFQQLPTKYRLGVNTKHHLLKY